jgi:hypothetical protein
VTLSSDSNPVPALAAWTEETYVFVINAMQLVCHDYPPPNEWWQYIGASGLNFSLNRRG